MGTKEILTLQFGHYSNYVGAHWWNIQEEGFEYVSTTSEIDHDVLYREGLTEQGEVTFTPRLLLVDLNGSLKTLSEQGDLYERLPSTSKENTVWYDNLVDVQKYAGYTKNKFLEDLENSENFKKVLNQTYNFEKDVSVWSDFLYSRFHPRTVNIIKKYQHCNENTPFDLYTSGSSLWKSPQFEDEFCDKIRNYVEECDSFQGFHVLTDCTDGFSGLSSSCLEYLQDDYSEKSALVFPVIPSHFNDNNFKSSEKLQSVINDSIRVLNLALSFTAFGSHSSLFVPLCTGSRGWRQPGPKIEFSQITYDHKLPYHSSAILASALETFTMKYRLKFDSFSMMDLCADLNLYGRKAAAASVCLPFSINTGCDLLECLDNWEGPLFQSITPNYTMSTEKMMQYITLRGISEDRLKKPPHYANNQYNLPAYKCNNISEMLSLYLSYSTYDSANTVTIVHKPLTVKTPFPKIFNKYINSDGNTCTQPRPENIFVESIPVLAGLHNGSTVGEMLESLHTEAKKIKIAKFCHVINGTIEKDEFEECLNNLFILRENYIDSNYL